MRRHVVKRGLTLAAIGVLALTTALVQAQPGGGGGRGGRGMMGGDPSTMMMVELAWAAVNFECELADDQFGALRTACQTAMDARQTAMAEARQAGNFDGVAEKVKAANTALEAEIAKILTEDQLKAVKAWQDQVKADLTKMMQAGGQGAMRGLMSAFYVDRLWGQATFTAKATDAQLKELKPDFAEEWDLRKEALEAGDMQGLITCAEEGNTVLMEALTDVLTADQMKLMQQRGPG